MRCLPTLLLVTLAGLCAPGCEDLADFDTGQGDVFYGEVIGDDRDGGMSFIRQGFPPHTQLELTFDPDAASANDHAGDAQGAGSLLTYRCPTGEQRCSRGERTPGHFDASPLEPIANLSSDALSQYDFPGGSRLRNYIFGARFRTPEDEEGRLRDAMVFLSLMENGKVELRVIAQSLLDADGRELQPALFGVFGLERRSR